MEIDLQFVMNNSTEFVKIDQKLKHGCYNFKI